MPTDQQIADLERRVRRLEAQMRTQISSAAAPTATQLPAPPADEES